VRAEGRALADHAVDLCREFSPRALFGDDRPTPGPLVRAAEGRRLLLSGGSPVCRSRARGGGGEADPLHLVYGHGAADLLSLALQHLDRDSFRPAHPECPFARTGFPAADLFPRPRHGVPGTAALAP